MPKKIIPSARKSLVNLRTDAKANAKQHDIMWGVAKKCATFLRPQKMDSKNPKKPATQKNFRGDTVVVPQRLNRVTRKHPLRVLLSAATAEVAAQLEREGAVVRNEQAGENSVGALPQISKGAELEFERLLIGYSQTVFAKAASIRDSIGIHSKVTAGSMQAACRITNLEIIAAGGIAPGVLVMEKATKKKKAKKVETAEEAVPTEA